MTCELGVSALSTTLLQDHKLLFIDGWQDTLTLAGGLIAVAGLILTLSGLSDLSRSLFPNASILPPTKVAGWSEQLLFKLHLRKRPPQIIGRSTIDLGAIVSAARVHVSRERPTIAASEAEWIDYLDFSLLELGRRQTEAEEISRAMNISLDHRLNAEEQARAEAISLLDRQITKLVAGEDGSGLRRAWWGVFAALVGLVLQGIASLAM